MIWVIELWDYKFNIVKFSVKLHLFEVKLSVTNSGVCK